MNGCAVLSTSTHPQMNPESYHPIQGLRRIKTSCHVVSLVLSLLPASLSSLWVSVSSSFPCCFLTVFFYLGLKPIFCYHPPTPHLILYPSLIIAFSTFSLCFFTILCFILSFYLWQFSLRARTLAVWCGCRRDEGRVKSSGSASCTLCSLNASLVTTRQRVKGCSDSSAAALSHFVKTLRQTHCRVLWACTYKLHAGCLVKR